MQDKFANKLDRIPWRLYWHIRKSEAITFFLQMNVERDYATPNHTINPRWTPAKVILMDLSWPSKRIFRSKTGYTEFGTIILELKEIEYKNWKNISSNWDSLLTWYCVIHVLNNTLIRGKVNLFRDACNWLRFQCFRFPKITIRWR
jgi:hypothetical protein